MLVPKIGLVHFWPDGEEQRISEVMKLGRATARATARTVHSTNTFMARVGSRKGLGMKREMSRSSAQSRYSEEEEGARASTAPSRHTRDRITDRTTDHRTSDHPTRATETDPTVTAEKIMGLRETSPARVHTEEPTA